jgi:UDP-N-acetylglucosamine--N-acetylmuramyl-(pentapeptide) pyrophosphoryl-undecaprenol N-acetylglucosamine transferase
MTARTLLVMAAAPAAICSRAGGRARVRDAGWRVVWLGNRTGMEATLVPKHGIPMDTSSSAACAARAW